MNSECPSREILEQMLFEQLEEATEETVCEHVEDCPACQQRMQALIDDRQSRSLTTQLAGHKSREDDEFFSRLKENPPSAEVLSGLHSSVMGRRSGARSGSENVAVERQRPVLPGYEILDELGRGGMGVVYKARQIALNRLVAVKTILAGSHASPQDRSRFQIEVEAAAALQHSNIVQVYEVGQHEGHPFFAMELIEGGTLRDLSGGAAQPPRDAALLVETLACAVHFAHERGIVHRDLKPANVLLQRSEQKKNGESTATGQSISGLVPKITDFGLAKVLSGEMRQTRTGAVIGTPEYMAPEQASGSRESVGPACDIYALGVILYELLRGQLPFAGATPAETLLRVLNDEPAPVGQSGHRVPRDLRIITHKCLDKRPQARYASARDLADDLRRFLEDRPIAAKPPSLADRARRFVRRRQGLVGGALAVCATATAVTILSLAFARPATQAPEMRGSAENEPPPGKAAPDPAGPDRALPGATSGNGELPGRITPIAYVVSNLNDSGPGSLRQAVLDSNAQEGADTVEFHQDVTGTIALTSGPLEISDSLTISGPGTARLAVSGSNSTRVLEIGGADVRVDGLTLAHGKSAGFLGGALVVKGGATLSLINSAVVDSVSDYGGGAWVQVGGILHIDGSTFSGNQSTKNDGGGGGLFIQGAATVTDSTFSGNVSVHEGGGLNVSSDAVLTVANSTIRDNRARRGGGISAEGSAVTLTNCTVSGNLADNGGGIYNAWSVIAITNCTIANNVAVNFGGGVWENGKTNIANSTLAGNRARIGGGISDDMSGDHAVTVGNTIIANNKASVLGANVINRVISQGHNLVGNSWGAIGFGAPGDLLNVKPRLGPLTDNGGPTQTMAPRSGSPAIDAGANNLGNYDDGAPPDPAKWTTGANQPPGAAAVAIQNGRLRLVNSGCLSTQAQCDPAEGGLTITGTWQFDGTRSDMLQIQTRSDGRAVDGSGETAHGIEFQAHARQQTMRILGRGSVVVSGESTASLDIPPNGTFHFEIVDDGANLSFTLTQVDDPANKATVRATCNSRRDTNYITFHNREPVNATSHVALLSDLIIRNQTTGAILLQDSFALKHVPQDDQRGPGFPRIVNGTVDIGAVEYAPPQSTP